MQETENCDESPLKTANLENCEESHLKEEKTEIKEYDSTDEHIEGERCPSCFHLMDSPQLKMYHGHPQNSVEEYIALTNDELALTAGNYFVVIYVVLI